MTVYVRGAQHCSPPCYPCFWSSLAHNKQNHVIEMYMQKTGVKTTCTTAETGQLMGLLSRSLCGGFVPLAGHQTLCPWTPPVTSVPQIA